MNFLSVSLMLLAFAVFFFGLYQVVIPIIPFKNKSEPMIYLKKGAKIVLVSVLILILSILV